VTPGSRVVAASDRYSVHENYFKRFVHEIDPEKSPATANHPESTSPAPAKRSEATPNKIAVPYGRVTKINMLRMSRAMGVPEIGVLELYGWTIIAVAGGIIIGWTLYQLLYAPRAR
jgi:hypothetical protein